jgi:hypothetical protein
VELNVYVQRDIANVLQAMACASEGSARFAVDLLTQPSGVSDEAEREKLLQAYRQGVCNTLVSVGLAFGLEPVGAGLPTGPGASLALAGLLWAEVPPKRSAAKGKSRG